MIVQDSQAITIPGTQFVLTYDRDEQSGRLLQVRYDDHEYLRWQDGAYIFGEGLAIVREAITPQKLLRFVRTNHALWTEEYRWDDQARLSYVDGVEIQRDDRNRIIACIGADSFWYYGYANDQLAVIETPSSIRHLTWDAEKRPFRIREYQYTQDIHYSSKGHRLDISAMPHLWNRDEWGRLWCIQDAEGKILTTYLWDGFACWGRIDGSPGDPLAAVFSLDPSLTPVRVITAQGMTQIPRDAYGEGLLKHPSVPGLYGGAVHQGYVYLRSRTLDPRVGAFNAPDPWHGLEDDPRRKQGYRGALTVETSAAGTYAVCQFDPVGRTDPTGEISFFLGLSTLTWSSQHNIAGFFFLELILNVLFTFLSFKGDRIKRLLDIEAYASDYHGGWGFRIDPVGIESLGINKGRAWTYQHIIWSQRSEFDDLAWARAFVPSNAFKPTCYGTLLQIMPQYGLKSSDPAIPLLLRGASNFTGGQIPQRALGWTRSGGGAEPVIPGSQVPIFPKGGIHFDQVQPKIIAPQDATIAELQPNGSLITGNLQERMVLVIPKTGLALANGNLLLITGAAGRTELVEIRDQTERSSQTRVRLVTDPTAIGTGLRVRRLGAVLSTQAMTLGTQPNRLKAQGVPIKYTQGNPLRLKQAGAVVGAVVIEKLEARLTIDTPLSKPRSRPPYKVSHAQLSGILQNVTVNSPQLMTFPAGSPVPNEGDAIAIQAAGQTMAVLITGKPGDRQRQIDRPLVGAIAGAAAGSVKWQPLRSILPLGTWDGTLNANPQITYTPDQSGIAPATNHLLVVDGGNKTVAVRDIKSITFDELVFPNPLPGVAANPYDVEQFNFQPLDEADASLEKVKALVLKPPVDATLKAVPKPAIHLHWLSAATLTGTPLTNGNPVLTNVPLAADKVILNPSTSAASYPLGLNNTQAPTPSQLMLLKSGANAEAAIVKQVQLSVTVDRPLGLAVGAKLEAVPLKPDGIAYQAESLAGNKVVLKPIAIQLNAADDYDRDATGNTKKVDVLMPRFTVGEIVQAMWFTGGVTQREYFRIKTVEGTLLELEGGVTAIATPTSTDLVILRMSPTNAETGSSRIAIEGTAASPTKIQFKVWQPNALKAGDIVAVTDSIKTLPAKVASQDELKIEFFPRPGATITTGAIDLVVPNLQASFNNSLYLSDYTLEGNDLILPSSVPLAVTPELFIGVLFQEPRAGAKINGRLSAGTVMIPQDSSETWELDRRDSLKTHELRHTQQSARLGPLLLQLIPWFALNAGAIGSDIEKPEYSPYVRGTIVTEGSNRFLDIPDFQNVDFESDHDVQLSQNLLTKNLKLGTRSNNRFQISGSDLMQDGTVFVRRLKSKLGKTLADIYAWGELDSVGGLMQVLTGPILTAIPWLVIQIVNAAKGNSFGSHYWLDYFPAQVSDPNKPSAIVLSPVGGKSLQLQPNDSVEIKVAGSTDRTTVTAVAADGSVELKDPPRTEGNDRRLEIAKLADDDPLGSVASTPLNAMGFGSLRWLFDPYGQLQFRSRPQVQGQSPTFEDWFLRSLRWAFSSTSWVGFPLAIFFFDNLLPQFKGNGHLSWMEQGASEQSGEVYSPIARLRGTLDYVGDIARYWYYPTDNTSTCLVDGKQDAPGVHIQPNVRLLPSFRDNPAAAGTLNQKREADPASGIQLPDWLVNKSPRNPTTPPATTPVGFLMTDLGWIPSSPELERSCGAYITFTRPGSHFVTLNDAIPGAREAREAQEKKEQTIFYEKTVRDVTVKVAGQPKNNGDTVKLVQCQRAVIEVEPGGDRRYSVTVMRPKDGDVLQKGGDLILQAQTTNNTETIEITRDYSSVAPGARNKDNRSFPELHLGGNFSIPVRSLKVQVVDQVDVRSRLNLTDPPLLETLPEANDAFILVPAKITAPPHKKATYAIVTTPKSTDPIPAIVPEKTIPSDLKPFLGDGGILKVTFAENDPPEEEVTLEWAIDVSANQLNAAGRPQAIAGILKASVKLKPHFRLLLPAAGTFQVARSANLTLEAKNSAGGNINVANVVVTRSEGITTTIAGNTITIAVSAAAATGTRTIVVEDATNPKHKARRTIEIT